MQQRPPTDRQTTADRLLRMLALVHSTTYVITGLWPFVSMRTFERATGPKRDHWLVHTVGALVTTVGAAMGVASARGRVTPEIVAIAGGTAASLAAIEVVYVSRGTLKPVYLLDAVGEVALLVLWTVALAARRRRPTPGAADQPIGLE